MLRVFPFAALRPKPELAAEVACPPYDVVDRAEARAIASASHRSFMHVVRPDADLPDSVDPYDKSVYLRGRDNLDGLVSAGAMFRDDQPRMYLYRQSAVIAGRLQTQTGVVCCCHVSDYNHDLIKKHEKTRKDKEDDRVRHILALNGHIEPVFLAYKGRRDIDEFVARACEAAPLYDFTADDGVRHTVWVADNAGFLADAFSSVPCAYVADGHHRSAAASRAAMERRALAPTAPRDAEFMRYLAVLFPADQLRILPYHRAVADLHGLSADEFVGRLGAVCEVAPGGPEPARHGEFALYLGKGRGWLRCAFNPGLLAEKDPVRSLDVSLLSDHVLGPILGIADLRTDKRIDFVGGIRGTGDLERRVDSGRAAAAFSMHPTTMGQLLAVADAGQMMPPKSTWFEPKLRSGLLVHMLD